MTNRRTTKGDHGFLAKARGSTAGGYVRARIQIGFDKTMLREVRARAKKNNRSFAAEVRGLIAVALGGMDRNNQ